MSKFRLAQRQIHLDFHTGPWIPGVGEDFNPEQFAKTMKNAHVESVTVFAKCHHGHLYYSTKHPARHPQLKRGLDLTGSQVRALHRKGIRAPIYISIQCDEFAANTHPEWIARSPEGALVGPNPLQPGWQILDMSSPYQDYLADQIEEVMERFSPVDGIFFDMCWDQPSLGHYAKARMISLGYDPAKAEDRSRYAHRVSDEYMARYAAIVRRRSPGASIYFNSRPLAFLKDDLPHMTHVEIEALATGGWGYMYFPRNVRFARTFNKPYMGMTARFHKSWADFGGLKPDAALLFEVSQMMAHGAQCSIGDQLHPRGTLDRASYDLIGKVYAHAEACEPWTREATPVTQIGLFRASSAGSYHGDGNTDDGATRMLTHLKHQFDVVTADSPLDRYALLILPDSVDLEAALVRKLRAFVKRGGSLLLSGASGLDANRQPLLPEMGVSVHGESPFQTTYIRFGKAVNQGVAAADHVMYERGLRLTPARGAEVLARVVEPYFDRNYQHFSSHFQTPPVANASRYAAAIRKGRVITIAFPIFKVFGSQGNLPYRQLVANCINLLMPQRLIEITAPSTTEVTVMRQGRRTVVHLLQFVAERRGQLDIIEDVVPLFNVPLAVRLAGKPRKAYLAPSRTAVPVSWDGEKSSVTIPRIDGHQMIVFE